MAKNFKIADIKNDSLYNVSLIDNWDGSTEQRKMTGAELVSFTNAFLHLYDIHAEEEKNMTEFTMIKAEVQQDSDKRKENTAFYIENGYFPTWAEEHHTEPERGLRQHSTARRWEQYKAGEITREKAVEFAIKRALKEIEKDTAAKLARLDRVAAAPDLTFISISVDWVRSRTWGNNPHAEARTNTGTFSGTASGCGYDKESTAIAEALNQCDSVLKVLYTLKENELLAGLSDKSKTAVLHLHKK